MGRLILRKTIIVSLIAVLITAVFTVAAMHYIINDNTRQELREGAAFILGLLAEGRSLDELLSSSAVEAGPLRLTLIAGDGQVLFDNRAVAQEMENHLARREVQLALADGVGEGYRLSKTLSEVTFYHAVLWEDGTVLRFAKTTESPIYTFYRLVSLVGIIIVAAVVIASFFADGMVKSIVTPINNLNLEEPLSNETYEELVPLLRRIDRQREVIAQQLAEREHRQEEFQTITEYMSEGLLILDSEAHVVTVNPSALYILKPDAGSSRDYIGRSVWQLTRDLSLQEAIQQGLGGEKSEIVLAMEERRYQVFVNPVFRTEESEGVNGLVLLFWDITQKYAAEQMRKEFSANVSHELKTPLTAISNYAELLKNDMVKPEDRQRFVERIYAETQRMIALVEDILKVSRLDEKVELHPKEDVDLLELARTVADLLEPLAERGGVTISVTGESVSIYGDRAILFDMLYNLCHNGIRYSRGPGGQVEIRCRREGERAVLEVADNGIGIPREHQPRIFERFYRVDKSHAKRTGGTGLGLAIVKHGAGYHNGEIRLSSAENKGTTITLVFPM